MVTSNGSCSLPLFFIACRAQLIHWSPSNRKKQDATRGGNEWEDSWRISLKRTSASSTYPPPWDPEKALASCNSFRRFAGARPFRNAAQRLRQQATR